MFNYTPSKHTSKCLTAPVYLFSELSLGRCKCFWQSHICRL